MFPVTICALALPFPRWLFEENEFYKFERLRPELVLYIHANRSYPGREAVAEDEAAGRCLAVSWFESTGGGAEKREKRERWGEEIFKRKRKRDRESDGQRKH